MGPVGLVGLVVLESLVDLEGFFRVWWVCLVLPNDSAWLGWSGVPALTISGFFSGSKSTFTWVGVWSLIIQKNEMIQREFQ